jgi:hypothetical protein
MWTRRTWIRALSLLGLPLSLAAAQEPTASLRGTVTDSIRHGPLVGATVVVSSRAAAGAGAVESHDYTATTDKHGKYAVNAIAPGTYVLTVEHPWLDSSGLSVPARPVDLRPRQSASMNLAVPSAATVRATVCGRASGDSTVGLVAGYVTEATTARPVAGARVVFVWTDFDVDGRTAQTSDQKRSVAVTTALDGTFRVCGLPVLRPILMQAQVHGMAGTGAEELQLPANGLLVKTLRVEDRPSGYAELHGVVVRTESERPLAGAHVHLWGAADSVTTADDGSFHLRDVPLGTQTVEVTALGFYPRRYTLDVQTGDEAKIAITMTEIATTLDSVRIIARRTNTPPWHAEFDDRSAHGMGQYITEEMIAKQGTRLTSELFQQVRGFNLFNGRLYSSRGPTSLLSLPTPNQPRQTICSPTVYVDGTPGGVDDISPLAIHGIEIYASSAEVPAKYHAGPCGAILVWTK